MINTNAIQLPPVAILAGGMATRLGPLAKTRPKALVEVAGRPFLAHQLQELKRQGIGRVVLCAGHLGEQIAEFVGDGSGFGLEARFSLDGEQRMGTGGALKKALPLLGEVFFVLYGDSFLRISYREVWSAFQSSPGASGLMTVFSNRDRWVKSNVLYRENKILGYDKKNPSPEMRHIDYGLSIYRNEAFDGSPANRGFDLGEVTEKLVREGRLAGFEAKSRFYEIGTPEGLAETSTFIEQGELSHE